LKRPIPFSTLLFDTLSDSSIPALLAGAPADVVVLERIARGAGATRWFVLHDPEELGVLVSRLSPGSSVSFYFDGRLAASRYDLSVRSELLAIAELDGDAVIGRLGGDQIELDVEFVAGPTELAEYESQLLPGATVIYGRFPARDNDGARAVTVDLPDRDGVVRPHPH
jgi:hypothetical protein